MKNIQKYRLIVQILSIIVAIFLFSYIPKWGFGLLVLLITIGGNFFCGWICPFGIFQDWLNFIAKKFGIRKRKTPAKIQKYLVFLRYMIFFIFIFLSAKYIAQFVNIDPFNVFLSMIFTRVISLIGLISIIIVLFIGLFYERAYCNYLCKQGALFGALSVFRQVTIIRDNDKCIGCKKCDQNCSMNIEVSKSKELNSMQCINCFKCISVCPVEGALKYSKKKDSKKSLILWILLVTLVLIYSIWGNKLNLEMLNSNKLNNNINKLEDGIYSGSADGYRGEIDVSVVIKKGNIDKIEVVKSADDEMWLERAKEVIETIIKEQTTEVDTISGATYSSKGIIEAVKNAVNKLNVNTIKNDEIESNEIENDENIEIKGSTIKLEDGTYNGSADGFRGKMEVSVTIKEGNIDKIEIIKSVDDKKWLERAKEVIETIIEEQTIEVDAICGATYSSKGIIEAVKNAIEK